MKSAREVNRHGYRCEFLSTRKIYFLSVKRCDFDGCVMDDVWNFDMNCIAYLSCNVLDVVQDHVRGICKRRF
ncbi:hypothetical protein NY2A_b155R [Paramecium bursaria Chlorella virus NY2A]|uniref:Uncharacterized protein b155R n=1 Tax=Paramecium bursaria Chlorella virus NY2A TaxID=46021 RepID=A7IW30_PBCVN|nr:hypothetical protein NY2A_b155R [Paramecium bursaria Chlorella virus NY2A]ABT14554.1 hypothetical protein NY2A_b155R [Paramecium bursaria Chlorella virus NY2A]